MRRFLNRVWTVVTEPVEADMQDASAARSLEQKLHATIAKVTADLDHFRFNTAISALMELNNQMMKVRTTAVAGTSLWTQAVDSMCLMMAPFFPHIAEELWHLAGHEDQCPSAELARPRRGTGPGQRDHHCGAGQRQGPRDRGGRTGYGPGRLGGAGAGTAECAALPGRQELRKAIVVPDKLVNLVV